MIRVWSWRLVCSAVQTASRITWSNTPDRCRPGGVHQSGIMYHIQILHLVCLQPPKSRVSVHLIVQYIVHSYKICSKCVHIDKHNISYKPFFGVKKYKTLSSFMPCQTYTHAVRFGAPQGRSPVAVSSATLYAWLWNRGMFAAHAPWKNVRWKFGHLQIHWNYSDPLRYMANR